MVWEGMGGRGSGIGMVSDRTERRVTGYSNGVEECWR